MNLTSDEKKAVGKVFRHFNNFSTHAEPISFTHTVLNRSFISSQGSQKAFLAGYLNHEVIITIHCISMCIFFIKLLDLSITKME